MPRISVNKLGQYVVCSSPARRRRIIHDQKHPNKVVVPMYRLAEEPVAEFFCRGRDRHHIDKAVVSLRSVLTGSTWAIADRRNTAEALDEILVLSAKLPSDGVIYVRGPDQAPPLHIKGVDVSVAPNLLLHFELRGVPCVGAVKFHYPKSEDVALDRDGGEHVATLLQKWLEAHGPHGRKVVASHCFSVDVFRRAVVAAPSASTRRMANVVAACEEISAHWEQL